MAFNKLTDAEDERLACLLEEMGEALHIIGKVLRHGYESKNPFNMMGRTNRQMLEDELGDVRHSMIQLCNAGDLSKDAIHHQAKLKAEKIQKYLHHQEQPNDRP